MCGGVNVCAILDFDSLGGRLNQTPELPFHIVLGSDDISEAIHSGIVRINHFVALRRVLLKPHTAEREVTGLEAR